MKHIKQDIRLSPNEKEVLKKKASECGMTVTNYIKYKCLDQNPDLLEDGVRYICPNHNKQGYFVAFSLIKIQKLLKAVLVDGGGMTEKKFNNYCDKEEPDSREILNYVGYDKIEAPKDE